MGYFEDFCFQAFLAVNSLELGKWLHNGRIAVKSVLLSNSKNICVVINGMGVNH